MWGNRKENKKKEGEKGRRKRKKRRKKEEKMRILKRKGKVGLGLEEKKNNKK